MRLPLSNICWWWIQKLFIIQNTCGAVLLFLLPNCIGAVSHLVENYKTNVLQIALTIFWGNNDKCIISFHQHENMWLGNIHTVSSPQE